VRSGSKTMTKRAIPVSLLALLVTASACAEDAAAPAPATPRAAGPDQPDSPWAKWKHEPALAACHAAARAQDDLPAGVEALGEACAAAGRMHPIGQMVVGTQQAHAAPFEIPMHVEADHCYRAYGMGAFSLLDLNVVFVDSLGRSAGGDASEGPIAVALEDGAVCFSQADDVKVNVSSGNGGGKFAVAIWAD
jgi:hypothetical protein